MLHRISLGRVMGCVTVLAAVVGTPSDASACGGCFNPVGSPAPVNAHRMAFSISPDGTTLWDQITYSGAPEDFVWVLPVRGTPMVELADEGFFEALTSVTQITLQAPTPPTAFCPSSGASFACGASAADVRGDLPPPTSEVTVYSESVVGPYETATVGATDPMALVEWLQAHEYAVDDALLPTIAYYSGVGANFVVLRLAPDGDVDRMQPVRITTPGLSLSLPLRMVAAGVQVTVDLELFVFALGRMEAVNYGNAEVDRDSIVYDWDANTFSYEAAFDDALFAGSGDTTNWVTEHASPLDVYALRSYVAYAPDGTLRSSVEDTDIAVRGLDTPYLTRLRTRLPPRELDRDLLLRASLGGDLENFVQVTREANRAPDAVCGSGGGCTAGRGLGVPVPLVLGLVPVALLWRRRPRR